MDAPSHPVSYAFSAFTAPFVSSSELEKNMSVIILYNGKVISAIIFSVLSYD